ncbi:MAG TPA: SPFH domain-containing protein [Acidobacteriaceae bacterium]
MALESASEIIVGVGVEAVLFAIVLAVIYRFLSGRFLVPKREIVLPNQRGVIVEGERVVRVAEPGTCWVRPKQRIILCDMRDRPMQLAGMEVVGSDNGIVRITLIAEYRIADASVYYTRSTNANDALVLQIRRALIVTARGQASVNIVAAPLVFAARILEVAAPDAAKLGFEIVDVQIVEAIALGWLQHTTAYSSEDDDPPSPLVH